MYYKIEVTHTGPTDPAAMSITEVADLNTAYMQLHQTFASAMANPNVTDALVIITDHKGAVMRYEYWQREEV